MFNALSIVRLFFSRTPEAFLENARLLDISVRANRNVIDDFSGQGFAYKLELSVEGVTRRFKVNHVLRTGDLHYDRKQHAQAASNVARRAETLGLVLAA